MSTRLILLLITLILIATFVAIYFILKESTNIGDFTYTTTNDTKKYDSIIRRGIAKWADMGVKGTHIYFRKDSGGNNLNVVNGTIARASGNTIFIVQSVFENLSTDKERVMTITHEVGHVLGIGLWGDSNVLTDTTGQKYLNPIKYPETAEAYKDHYRPATITLPGPPIETEGGQGTASVHWENDPTYGMNKSIMVGTIYINSDLITIVDLTFLKEIGVKVDDVNRGQKLTIFYKLRDMIIKDRKINE